MEDNERINQQKSASNSSQKNKAPGLFKRLKVSFISWVMENTVLILFIVTGLYGLGLLLFGLYNGVYLSELVGLYADLKIEESSDSYIISFYASAEQDYWFFVFIGIMAWFISFLSSRKEAKNDKLITKINHFFPEIDPSSAHMRYLEQKINELSCIADYVSRKVIISSFEDNLIETQITVVTKLVNIHHNHDLTENFGEFYVTQDDAVKSKKPWGRLNMFIFDTPSMGSEELVKPQNFPAEKFHEKYNIKLNREEVGTLSSNYSSWAEIKENSELTPAFFTRQYCFEIVNNTASKLKIRVSCTRHPDSDIILEPNKGMDAALVFKNIRPDEDSIIINVKEET